MEDDIRAAVAQVLDDPACERWIAEIDQNPMAVGEHVLCQLPQDNRHVLSQKAKAQVAKGSLHLHDVFDAETQLPDSPTDFVPLPACRPVHAARMTVLAINALLGQNPVSYGSENDGHLFVNLVAMPGTGRKAEKSIKGMRGHTDAVSFPFPGQNDPGNIRIPPSPDSVCLVGLRNSDDVSTMIIPLHEVLGQLSPTDITELKQFQFLINCQGTFREGTERELGNSHKVDNTNILLESDNRSLWIRFSHSNVAPSFSAPDAARTAIENFEAACLSVAKPVVVRAGDVLIIDNRTMLHGRSGVGKEVGGNARWLLRSYGLARARIPNDSFHTDSLFKLWP